MKGSEDNAWLLIKHKDKYAVDTAYDSEKSTPGNSPINKALKKKVKTGGNYKKAIVRLRGNKKYSQFIKPMLAKLVDEPFDDENWIFEIKWDGYRAITEIRNGIVKIYSRNGISLANHYPPVFVALQEIDQNVILDGEIVVLNEDGKSDFQMLQQYDLHPELPIRYYVFDLLVEKVWKE